MVRLQVRQETGRNRKTPEVKGTYQSVGNDPADGGEGDKTMTEPSKCKWCGAETEGSDECWKCLQAKEEGVDLAERKRLREELAEKCAESHLGTLEKKAYPNYATFCDDPEEQTGFKPARVSQWLHDNEHFKTDKKTGLLYYGDKTTGVWSEEGEIWLEQILTVILGEHNTRSYFINILHALKGLTYADITFSEKIAVENGLLDLETLQLSPFSLDEMALHKVNVCYNKEVKSEHWLEFLKTVVSSEDAITLQEWSGYLLLLDYRFHKIMWLHGGGRNGKDRWVITMETILGEDNISSIGLEEFDGKHHFSMSQLYHKLLNTCNEPRIDRNLETNILKKATGQNLITAEIKHIQKRLKFRNYAKITVIANRFPKVNDTTTAFKDRRIFITFPNQFTGENCIPNIERNWLDDPIERMGVFNWMLEGLQRLLINGKFTESKTQKETELAFERASDTISAFLNEIAIFDKNLVTTRTEAYEAYKDYCDMYGLENESNKHFTQRLKETPRISVTKVRQPKQERAWKGLGLKTLDNDTEGTDGTHLVQEYKLNQFNENQFKTNINSEKSVPTVPPVTGQPKNCGHCVNFRMPNCESEAWETRSGNAEPYTNWCFKPIGELEE